MKHKKKKVLAYITRTSSKNDLELLTFRHRDFPAAGLQVPAGTVDSGESPDIALVREVAEESGLDISSSKRQLLGIFNWMRIDRNEIHERHVYQIELNNPTENSWSHVVSGHGEDESLVFVYQWRRISSLLVNELAANQGIYLKQLL